MSEQELRNGKTYEVGEYHVWYFNVFRADLDWSKDEDKSEHVFGTYAELLVFLGLP